MEPDHLYVSEVWGLNPSNPRTYGSREYKGARSEGYLFIEGGKADSMVKAKPKKSTDDISQQETAWSKAKSQEHG
ncbi:hypothetical protein HPP92_016795 [Vanilla planifolia]|uniref:Uncharacterized protein n=1 Tax=Vanilla planifolia TaxID=51239 RepID=A0A835UPE2_VANPL|nr:hypothetical protein HPP92_017424 [Vanilla planifolia]KAG0472249.1 hypothetical protein HPP92_016795 [Vanilla planifolia]